MAAAYAKNKPVSQWLLKANADVGSKNDRGMTVLHFLCASGMVEEVQQILRRLSIAAKMAAMNQHDKDGLTPLQHVCDEQTRDKVSNIMRAFSSDADLPL